MNTKKDAASKITFKTYNPVSQFDRVKEIWILLQQKCPHAYWLSWAWTEIWIKELPPDSKLSLVVGFNNEFPVIAFFIGYNETIRHRYFKVRQIALNQTLIPRFDVVIYVEYNAILIDPEITISLESLLELIPIKLWDEFVMIRFAPMYQPNLHLNDCLKKKYDISLTRQDSYYVNLDKVRRNNNDYLALLTPNRRNQIRRSLKEYEKFGKIQIIIAESTENALNILDELIQLHQKRWTERGERGAFSTEYDIEYHRSLICKRFEHGEIQLIKICAGDYTIGCVYNFIYRGNVLQVQGGFNYLPGNVYRPGFVCHYLAILHNAEIGLDSYDFLADSTDYKISLSTDFNEMHDIVLEKRSVKSKLQKIMVKLYRIIKKLRI